MNTNAMIADVLCGLHAGGVNSFPIDQHRGSRTWKRSTKADSIIGGCNSNQQN